MGLMDNFIPDALAHSVADIDFDELEELGVRGLLIDVDNTLIGHGSLEMTPERLAWAHEAMERFSVSLLSNSVRGRRVRHLCDLLGCQGVSVWMWNRKPFSGGVRKALKEIGTAPEETAMIGDQLLTDVLGGNRAGLYTIWIDKIYAREFVFTRYVQRMIERFLIWWLKLPTHEETEREGGTTSDGT